MSKLKQTLFSLKDADKRTIEETLKEKDEEINQLKQELAELKEKAIVPKFNRNDKVFALFTATEIYSGEIDAFDYYSNSYLIYPNYDIGNEWIKADKVFATEQEAQDKLKEIQGNE